ncbi:TonB-dependent siderophore receptor [Vibrio sp. WXL210]|uniref:TonB-dependent siderophore receptor n=1 Tax=Vibrio sp. WXL210 TaxID=3450709 RepID=UPI003EC839A8
MTFKPSTVSTAILAALASGAAIAQDNTELQTDESMTITGRSFEDYKVDHAVGAMRTDATLLETPQSVTVIPEIILDEQLATTLSDALENDASISAGTKKWNREVFSSRGFELSSSTGYLRNGHPQFSHYMQPIETLERIEVLKGPSSLLYGTTEPGGLINMVTKKPTHVPMVNIGTDFDDNGSTRYQIDASGALNESGSVRGRTVLVKQDTESSREFRNGTNQERDRFLGFAVVEADLTDDLLLSVHYERTHDDAQLDTGSWIDGNGNVIGDPNEIRDAPWAFINNNVENIGADLTYFVNPDWTLAASYNYQSMYRHRRDSSPGVTGDTIVDGSYELKPFDRLDHWQHHTFHFDVNGDFRAFGVDHRTLFGINGQFSSYKQKRDSYSGDSIIVGPGDEHVPTFPDLDYERAGVTSRSESQTFGIYAQDMVSINDQWQVVLGLRFDAVYQDSLEADGSVTPGEEGSGDASAFSPKVGVIYHPAHNGSIYASYAESFSYNSNQYTQPADEVIVWEFDPTYSTQYELGTKWELMDDSLLLSGAIFHIEKEDIVLSEGSRDDTVYFQEGSQVHKGAEAAAQGRIGEKLFVMASAMYLDAEYTNHNTLNGNTPANVPEWQGSAWTRYALTDFTALNLGMNYQGERWADRTNTIKLDGYARFDAGASHKVKSGDVVWDFRFNIENLFDKEYVSGTGGGSYSDSTGVLTDVHYGDERRFKFSVNATF